MKNGITLVTAFSFVVLLSCQDPKDEVSAKLPDVSLYKTVGMKIPTETGARWIQAYNSVNNISARTEGVLYSVDKTDLEKSLDSVNNLTGRAFNYALDE